MLAMKLILSVKMIDEFNTNSETILKSDQSSIKEDNRKRDIITPKNEQFTIKKREDEKQKIRNTDDERTSIVCKNEEKVLVIKKKNRMRAKIKL